MGSEIEKIRKGEFRTTLMGHLGPVRSVAISPDLKYIASGSEDNSIKLWNLQEKIEEYAFIGHSKTVNSVVFSSNSRYIVSGSEDKSIIVWNLLNKIREFTLTGHSGTVFTVQISSDLKFIVSGSEDSSIKVWNFQEKKEECTLKGHLSAVRSVAISSNSKYIVSGSDDTSIKLWSLQEEWEESTSITNLSAVNSVAISHDLRYIVGGLADNSIKIWNLKENIDECTLLGPWKSILSVAISSDSKYVLSGSEDNFIKVWNIQEKREEYALAANSATVFSVAISLDSKYIVAGLSDKSIILWNLQEKRENFTLAYNLMKITSVTISPKSKFIVSIWDKKCIKVWDLKENKEQLALTEDSSEVCSFEIDRNSKFILIIWKNSLIQKWDLKENKKELEFIGNWVTTSKIVISSDLKYIAGTFDDESARLWNIDKQCEECILCTNSICTDSIEFSPNSEYILILDNSENMKVWYLKEKTAWFIPCRSLYHWKISPDSIYFVDGNDAGSMRVWNLKEKKLEWRVKISSERHDFFRPVISPDSKYIIGCLMHSSIKIWNLKEKREVGILVEYSSISCGLVVSSDSKYIVGAGNDNSIKIWNLKEQREECTLIGHYNKVQWISISEDLNYIVSGASDNLIKIWNLQEKRDECTLIGGHWGSVYTADVSKDSKYIVNESNDGSIKVWNIEEKREELAFTRHCQRIKAIIISLDSKYIVSRSRDDSIKVWNLEEKKEEFTLWENSSTVFKIPSLSGPEDIFTDVQEDASQRYYPLAISEDSKYITSGFYGIIVVWNIQEKREEVTFKTGKLCKWLAISPDSKYIVSQSQEDSIRVWNLLDKTEEITSIKQPSASRKWPDSSKHSMRIFPVAISSDSKYVVSGAGNIAITVWNLKEKKEECTLIGHSKYVLAIVISLDSKYIVSGSEDTSIKVWNLEEKREEFTLEGYTDITHLSISSDSKYIVSYSYGNSIKLWNLQEKREECTLIDQIRLPYLSLSISSNSKYLLLESRLMRMQNGRVGFTIAGCDSNNISAISISQDGNYIFLLLKNNSIKIWSIKENQEISASFKINGQPMLSSDNKYILYEKKKNPIIFSNPNSSKDLNVSRNDFGDIKSLQLFEKLSNVLLRNEFIYGPTALRELIKYIPNETTLFWGPESYDNIFFSNKIPFYNALDCMKSKDFSNVSQEATEILISEFHYTIVHFISYLGESAIFNMLIKKNPKLILKTDLFGRSPIYYSIIKEHQICTDSILNFLISIEDKNSMQFKGVFFAIRNDFNDILKNSSKLLPKLLDKLLISTNYMTVPDIGDFPMCIFHDSTFPKIEYFSESEVFHQNAAIPAIFKYSLFPFPSLIGSKDTIELLKSIICCNNNEIFKIPVIQYIIDYQWQNIKKFASFYTFMMLANIITFLLLLEFDFSHLLYLASFLSINLLLIAWEAIQIISSFNEYFEDPWNILDICRIITTIIWIIVGVCDKTNIYLTILVAVFTLIRGLTVFKLFDGTRYYIHLILKSLNDIKYFIVIFSYSTFIFGVLFKISRQETLSFNSLWKESWGLNFGSSTEPTEDTNHILDYIVFLGAIIMNVVLMLNMLISILGDSYEQFQIEKAMIDYREKVEYVFDLQKLMPWIKIKTSLKYLHALTSPFEDEDSGDWYGRIIYMEKKTEKSLNNLQLSIINVFNENQISTTKELKENKDLIESELKESRSSAETKINEVEKKISEVEKGLRENIDTKISLLDEGFKDKISLLDTGFRENISSVETKISSIEEKINRILDILAK